MKSIPLNNKKFIRIISFYLFECPVVIKRGNKEEAVSVRGKSFRDFGIEGSHAYKSFLKEMKNRADSKTIEYAAVKTESDILVKEKQWNQIKKDSNYEFMVIYDAQKIGVVQCVFYCIRNALAHGDFDYSGETYVFTSRKNGKFRGRIRLREQTLLNWIEILKKWRKV